MVSQNTDIKKERTGVAEGVYAIEDSKAMFEAIGAAGAAGDQLSDAASEDKDFDGMLNDEGEFDPKHLTDVLPYGDTVDDNGERFPDMNGSIPELTDDDKKFVVDEFARKLQEMGTTQIDDPQITALAVTIKGENGFPQDIEGFIRETINSATTRIGAQNVSNALPSGAKADGIAPLADGGVAAPSADTEFAPAMTAVPSSAPALTPNADEGFPGGGAEPNPDMNLGLDTLGGGEGTPALTDDKTGFDEPKDSANGEPENNEPKLGEPKDDKSDTGEPAGTDAGDDEKKPEDKDGGKPEDDLGLNLDNLGDGDFSPDADDEDKGKDNVNYVAPKTEWVAGKPRMEGETVADCGKACGTQTDCQCKDGKKCECKNGKCKDGSKCECGTALEDGEDVPETSDAGADSAEGGTDVECALGKIRGKYMESVQSERKAKMESVVTECKAKMDIQRRLDSRISAKIEAIRDRYADGKRTAKLEAICKKHSGVDSLVAECRNAKDIKAKLEGISKRYHAAGKSEAALDRKLSTIVESIGKTAKHVSADRSLDRKLSAIVESIGKTDKVDARLGAIISGIRKDASVSARLESIAAETDSKMKTISEKKKISAKFDALLAKKKA